MINSAKLLIDLGPRLCYDSSGRRIDTGALRYQEGGCRDTQNRDATGVSVPRTG